MTSYQNKTFTVPQSGRDPETCGHGWKNDKQQCVFCGKRFGAVQMVNPQDWYCPTSQVTS
jgi:hypothetical protein